MGELPVRRCPGRDGCVLAYRELGAGRPVVLLHGFFAFAEHHWVRPGHAAALAALGRRVVLPDMRAHGASPAPRDPARYPPDVLVDDALALVEHLGLVDYDLGGYSLGARVAVRMVVRGATPRRLVVGGQGLREVGGRGGAVARFLRSVFEHADPFPPGSPEAQAQAWLLATGGDGRALANVLDSLVETPEEQVRGVVVPTLVVTGADDERSDSAAELAAALPHGALHVVPGDHTAAIAAPELTTAITDFLATD